MTSTGRQQFAYKVYNNLQLLIRNKVSRIRGLWNLHPAYPTVSTIPQAVRNWHKIICYSKWYIESFVLNSHYSSDVNKSNGKDSSSKSKACS